MPPPLEADPAPMRVDAAVAMASSPGLERGARIGRYVIVDEVGAGGMGQVFAAFDPDLDRRVAIKLVAPHVDDGAGAQKRLLREAQALARLGHPNVVRVFDAGTHRERVWLAMEYIDGVSLRDFRPPAGGHRWQRLLDVLLQAGAGLAAAHRAGLVHRDFKPGNVMVRADPRRPEAVQRVFVVDFGLAQTLDDAMTETLPEGPAIDDLPADRPLTVTGRLLGTPAYMAPEQLEGKAVDERSDQFSFCLVAFQMLFDVLPFDGDTIQERRERLAVGTLPSVRRTTAVPRAIRAALERGLSSDPALRWPSMDALLARLRFVRRRRTRLVAAVAGVAALAGGAGAMRTVTTERPCRDLGVEISAAWSPEIREAGKAAFVATGLSYASESWGLTERALDAYVQAHAAARTDACLATHVRDQQSEALLDLEMACFDEERRDFSAFVDLLLEADATVVENAAKNSQEFGSLERCSDVEALTAAVDPPAPAMKAEVAALEEVLPRMRALVLAGKAEAAVAEVEPFLARARSTDYPPVISSFALLLGQALQRVGRHDESLLRFEEGLQAAARADDRRVEGHTLVAMANVLGLQLRTEEAVRLAERGAVSLRNTHAKPADLWSAELIRINAYFVAGDHTRAEPLYEELLAQTEDDPAAVQVRLAAQNNLAGTHVGRGEFDEAASYFEAALANVREVFGDEHPRTAMFYNNLGILRLRLGDYPNALAATQRALAIYTAVLGPRTFEIGRTMHNEGAILRGLGLHEASRDRYAMAMEIKAETVGTQHPSYVASAFNLAEAMATLGQYDEALSLALQAERLSREQTGETSVQTMMASMTVASILLALDRIPQAAEAAQRAVRALDEIRADVPEFDQAAIEFLHARVLWAQGHPAEARRRAEGARNRLASAQGHGDLDLSEVDDWLASHRLEADGTRL